MSAWGQVTWDIARAGGFVAYGLLTLSVALGLALSMRWQSVRWPRLMNSELHNFVTLLALIFTALHILAVWLDPFTAFGWTEIFIPFVSHYRPIWMALGIIAFYLGLALSASVWLRPRMGYEWWRRLHTLTLLVFALVTAHGITTGSDTQTPWAVIVYGLSGLLVAALLWIRLLVPASPQQRRHPVWVGVAGLTLFAGVTLAVIGPMRPGWNAFANGGAGSGQRGGTPPASATPTATRAPDHASVHPITPPFQTHVTGSLSETGPDARGQTTMKITATFSGGQGVLEIELVGAQTQEGHILVSSGQAMLGSDWSTPNYEGALTTWRSDGNTWTVGGTLKPMSASGQAISFRAVLTIASDHTVTGTARGMAANNGANGDSGDGGDGGDGD